MISWPGRGGFEPPIPKARGGHPPHNRSSDSSVSCPLIAWPRFRRLEHRPRRRPRARPRFYHRLGCLERWNFRAYKCGAYGRRPPGFLALLACRSFPRPVSCLYLLQARCQLIRSNLKDLAAGGEGKGPRRGVLIVGFLPHHRRGLQPRSSSRRRPRAGSGPGALRARS